MCVCADIGHMYMISSSIVGICESVKVLVLEVFFRFVSSSKKERSREIEEGGQYQLGWFSSVRRRVGRILGRGERSLWGKPLRNEIESGNWVPTRPLHCPVSYPKRSIFVAQDGLLGLSRHSSRVVYSTLLFRRVKVL